MSVDKQADRSIANVVEYIWHENRKNDKLEGGREERKGTDEVRESGWVERWVRYLYEKSIEKLITLYVSLDI